MTHVTLDQVRAADGRHGDDIELSTKLTSYYYESPGEHLQSALRLLGMGVGADKMHHPEEVGLLKYSIHRQTVTYSNNPMRWVRGNALPTTERNQAGSLTLTAEYKRAKINSAMKEAERLANLHGVTFLRLYPGRRHVEVRLFRREQVLRMPTGQGFDLEDDRAFALQIGDDLWELWERTGTTDQPKWRVTAVDGKGEAHPDKDPFRGNAAGQTNVYAELPVMAIYDRYPTQLWPVQKARRIANLVAIDAVMGDITAAVKDESHRLRVWFGLVKAQLPKERGQGQEVVIDEPKGQVDVLDLEPHPAIAQMVEALSQKIQLFLVAEDLPPDDLDKSKQVLTGAALRTRLFGLLERRKDRMEIAVDYEGMLWLKVRSVHNPNVRKWTKYGGMALPAGLLEVEMGAMELPVEPQILVDTITKEIAQGLATRVDGVMRTRGVDRAESLRILHQNELDDARFPPQHEVTTDDNAEGPDPATDPDDARSPSDQPDAANTNPADDADA